MAGAEQVGDVADGLGRQHPHGLVVDLEEPPPPELDLLHPVGGQEPVGGGVLAEGEQVGEGEVGRRSHVATLAPGGRDPRPPGRPPARAATTVRPAEVGPGCGTGRFDQALSAEEAISPSTSAP